MASGRVRPLAVLARGSSPRTGIIQKGRQPPWFRHCGLLGPAGPATAGAPSSLSLVAASGRPATAPSSAAIALQHTFRLIFAQVVASAPPAVVTPPTGPRAALAPWPTRSDRWPLSGPFAVHALAFASRGHGLPSLNVVLPHLAITGDFFDAGIRALRFDGFDAATAPSATTGASRVPANGPAPTCALDRVVVPALSVGVGLVPLIPTRLSLHPFAFALSISLGGATHPVTDPLASRAVHSGGLATPRALLLINATLGARAPTRAPAAQLITPPLRALGLHAAARSSWLPGPPSRLAAPTILAVLGIRSFNAPRVDRESGVG